VSGVLRNTDTILMTALMAYPTL